jgi:hypothetical protein
MISLHACKAGEEALIAFKLFARLRRALNDSILLLPEVKVPSAIHRSGYMRVDIGIGFAGQLIAAIEVKRGQRTQDFTRQRTAYASLERRDTKVFWVEGRETLAYHTDEITRWCQEYIATHAADAHIRNEARIMLRTG